MIRHQRLITRRICKSYSIWILLVVDQRKDSKQNKQLERAIEMQEWNDFSNQMKPTETCYSYKVRMKFYVNK